MYKISNGLTKDQNTNNIPAKEQSQNEENTNKFLSMYLIDPKVEERNKEILDTGEIKTLMKKVNQYRSALVLLDEIVPESRPTLVKRLNQTLNPFYNQNEYDSKDDYLQYLKKVYGFLISPLESPPGRFMKTFYKSRLSSWQPEPEQAKTLIKQFYLETKLIQDMSAEDWAKVRSSSDPESAIFRLLYGIKFSQKFKIFLSTLPWRVSHEPYGAPGLDLISWRTPGPELAKRPMAVEMDFINRLVQSSETNEAYREILIEAKNKYLKLNSKKQVLSEIKFSDKATIDSYVGISKRETDFVLHQRIIIWKNPGFNKYHKLNWNEQLGLMKPSKYLATINERVVPLEIPFLNLMKAQR